MKYSDSAVISRPSGTDTQDADGTVNTGSETQVYSGGADFQEGNFTRLVNSDGAPEATSNGAVYTTTLTSSRPGDLIQITRPNGDVLEGVVVRVSTIDERVFVLVN